MTPVAAGFGISFGSDDVGVVSLFILPSYAFISDGFNARTLFLCWLNQCLQHFSSYKENLFFLINAKINSCVAYLTDDAASYRMPTCIEPTTWQQYSRAQRSHSPQFQQFRSIHRVVLNTGVLKTEHLEVHKVTILIVDTSEQLRAKSKAAKAASQKAKSQSHYLRFD